jgi:SAM-dependent methyltransferase
MVSFFNPQSHPNGRLDATAFHRNHEPIWRVLEPHLRGLTGDVLEAGSGTGQHIVEFARKAPHLTWWPSDPSEAHLRSIAAWAADAKLSNLRPARPIDLADPEWQWGAASRAKPRALSAIFCANVIHIAPWAVAEGLFAGAGRHLQTGGLLFLYGPFKRDGRHTAPSNEAFDASLRANEPQWGVRDMADVIALGERNSLYLVDTMPMPANNFTLIFRHSEQHPS